MNQPKPETVGAKIKEHISTAQSIGRTIEKIAGNQPVGTNHINTGHLGRE
jgi:hypothetical protein